MDNFPHKNTINTLYFMLVLSTVLGFVFHVAAFLASVALWLTVLVAAYYYRAKDKENGLLFNHMTYLIGTIWIGTTFLVVASLAAAYWIYTQGNDAAMVAFANQFSAGAVTLNEESFMQVVMQYWNDNRALITTASIVTVGPAILYFVYRIGNGFGRACKGYRIANPKSWL